jgi:hypothetical protein
MGVGHFRWNGLAVLGQWEIGSYEGSWYLTRFQKKRQKEANGPPAQK